MRTPLKRTAIATILVATLAFMCGCAAGHEASPPPPDPGPALTDEKIRETIYDAGVEDVPEVTGAAKPITWFFERDEPLEVTIVDRQAETTKATVVVDVATRSAPRSRNPVALSGRIRLHYELRTEFILRRWRIVRVDNVSMTYREEPKPYPDPDVERDGARPPEPPPPATEP